jgi:hypothetical protein
LTWAVPGTAAALVAPFAQGGGGDGWQFVSAGRVLLSSHWDRAFSDPGIQVGPLQLLVFGSIGRRPTALSILIGVTAALLVVLAARETGVRRSRVLVCAGLAAVATGLTASAIDSGHPAEALLPLLWTLAGGEARRGRPLRAGAIVGLSAGIETWGVLGIAVLALAPSLRSFARATAVAAAAAGLQYLPFVLSGRFEMGAYHWFVSPQSLLSLVVPAGTPFGWGLRFAQGALALAAGITLARLAHRTRHALWLVPGVVVLARLLVDPLDSYYYFVAIEAPALVGLALVAARGLRLRAEPQPV